VVPAEQRGNVHGQPLDDGGVPPVGRHAAPPPHGRRLRMWRQWQDGTRCAANMAADGRRVVGGGRGTSCGTCEAVRAPQGQNLTALHAAAAAKSRENLLRRMPWHLCIKIVPRHSTDLVELRSPISWSALYPFRTHHYAGRNISCHLGLARP
jgi:hypothetical protein